MTPEIEMSPPSVGSNGGDNSDTTITRYIYITSESNASSRDKGRGRGGRGGRGGHQERNRKGGRFNCPLYTPYIQNFKG